MKTYIVQFALPCEDPENNVFRMRKKDALYFLVPINHPLVDKFGITDLLAMSREAELPPVSTPLKNKNRQKDKDST